MQPVEEGAPAFKYPGGATSFKGCLGATLPGTAALKDAAWPDDRAFMMFANIDAALCYRMELTKDGALGVHPWACRRRGAGKDGQRSAREEISSEKAEQGVDGAGLLLMDGRWRAGRWRRPQAGGMLGGAGGGRRAACPLLFFFLRFGSVAVLCVA